MLLLQGTLNQSIIVLFLNELFILQATESVMWFWRYWSQFFCKIFWNWNKNSFLRPCFMSTKDLKNQDTSWPRWTGQMPINTLRVYVQTGLVLMNQDTSWLRWTCKRSINTLRVYGLTIQFPEFICFMSNQDLSGPTRTGQMRFLQIYLTVYGGYIKPLFPNS